MIHLNSTRFGDISIEDSAEIIFPKGLIGFSGETRFAILERARGPIAYLQSLTSPHLALPVIDASIVRPHYPHISIEQLAAIAGIERTNIAVLVVVAVNPADKSLRANLLAPIVVDVDSRTGNQIILEGTSYKANTPLGDKPMPMLSITNGAPPPATQSAER